MKFLLDVYPKQLLEKVVQKLLLVLEKEKR